jgi:hypothetical protein
MENRNTDTLCLSSTDAVSSNLNCKTYAGIDVWKFVMSFAVIALHCQSLALGEYSGCINWFITLAVPFFFIVSGFLLASKLEGTDTVSLKRALLYARFKQVSRLFFSWLIVYLPISVYLAVMNNTVWYRAVASYILQVLFYGHSAYAWPLWYVYSMAIVSYLLYKFFYKSHRSRIILAFTFIIAYIVAALVPIISFPSSLCSRALGGGNFYALWNLLV